VSSEIDNSKTSLIFRQAGFLPSYQTASLSVDIRYVPKVVFSISIKLM
jgi:hypothetical protein